MHISQFLRTLPDIAISAAFWAAIATLWGAAGAWFTFVLGASASHQETHRGVLNLIAGIEAELELVEKWASGAEGDQGYLKSDDTQDLVSKHPDWFNPSRHIYTFLSPTLNNFTSSPFLSRLLPIVPPLVRLSYSIHRLFDFVTTTYNPFIASDPTTYQEVVRKVTTGVAVKSLLLKEQVYVNFVFGMNRTIHQGLIGGADSTDEFCLYKAFRNARTVVAGFKTALRPEPLPRWYWILHILAAFLIAISFFEVSRWFKVVRP